MRARIGLVGAFLALLGCAESHQMAPTHDAGTASDCRVRVWIDDRGHPHCEPIDACELEPEPEWWCPWAVERCLIAGATECVIFSDGTGIQARDGG